MPTPFHQGQRAIVIGEGIAGLLAAHVLSRFFPSVVVIERDWYPSEPVARSGAPQSKHLHLFLLGGQKQVFSYFPLLRQRLLEAGAVEVDFLADGVYCFTGGAVRGEGASPLRGVSCTRNLWEWYIRQELRENASVTLKEGYEVTGLVVDDQRVAGVQVRARRAGTAQGMASTETLLADFVVDASGRDSRAPQWFEGLGYPSPYEQHLDAHLGYASRCYSRMPGSETAFVGVQMQAPDSLMGGALFPIEDEKSLVVLMGAGGNYPPTDEVGFREFARSLFDPALSELLEQAQPCGEIAGYRNTRNRFRHFEHIKGPAGFLVMGDALCCFNPAYGQGMTVAALEVAALEEALCRAGRRLEAVAPLFYRKALRILSMPWAMATSSDDRVPNVDPRPRRTWFKRLLYWYNDGILALVPRDPFVRDSFFAVWHMLCPSTLLFHPRLLFRVVRFRVFGEPRVREGQRQVQQKIGLRVPSLPPV